MKCDYCNTGAWQANKHGRACVEHYFMIAPGVVAEVNRRNKKKKK